MMYLGEHRAKPDRLSDLLPWAALVAPGVVLNKDGSFLPVIKFRGPDLDSATEPQVVVANPHLGNALHEVGFLQDAALLTFLHGTISTKLHPVAVPETPAYLDALLADSPLTGGLQPRLGDAHLRVISITGFPGSTTPALLDALNRLPIGYRSVSRYLPLDETDATKLLDSYRR